MELTEVERVNTVSVFLMPLIGLKLSDFEFIHPRKGKQNRFFNAYLFDEKIPKYSDGYITVVYHGYQDTNFPTFEKKLKSADGYTDSYSIPSSEYEASVFKFEDESLYSYHCFKRGKYSQFGINDKLEVIRNSFIENGEVLSGVFSRDKDLRKLKEENLGVTLAPESELWSIYNPKLDILTSTIKKLLTKRKLTSSEAFS